jgi:hypothetical protein
VSRRNRRSVNRMPDGDLCEYELLVLRREDEACPRADLSHRRCHPGWL